MKYATVCSGIEACSAAWEPLGWHPVFFSEIEKFPSAVLAHHYPKTPNLGDMTKINGNEYRNTIDVFCGGTPCQSFSVAGLRGGLGDERGNLALTFCRLVDQIRPTWVVWENVPGVLSSNKGRDFGSILGALGELGYGFTYRVLDAQYFGVPQRRRRVFVVGHIGGFWQPAAAVLFESKGLLRDSTPGASSGQGITAYTKGGFGEYREGVGTLTKSGGDHGGGSETLVFQWKTSGARNLGVSNTSQTLDKSKIPAVCFTVRGGKEGGGKGYLGSEDKSLTLTGVQHNYFIPKPAVMFPGNWIGRKPENGGNGCEATTISPTLTKMDIPGVADSVVRRITPREAGRLQGFPDDYTAIYGEKTPDKPQYAAYGNSMAVPVMQWIGRRIELVDKILNTQHT